MKQSRGVIVITTFSRAKLLADLLESLERVEGASEIPLVVVQQRGSVGVSNVLEKRRQQITIFLETEGIQGNPARSISRNRLAGLSVGFNALNADWALVLEDDVVLAPDILNLVRFVLSRYERSGSFRGINFASRIPRSESDGESLSRVRYGVYGGASLMPKAIWKRLEDWGVLDECLDGDWDSAMEAFMKTGMTIVPNASRVIDQGWGGTHMSNDPESPYFREIRNSFVGGEAGLRHQYRVEDMDFVWRHDLRKFRPLESPSYWWAFFINRLTKQPLVRRVRRGVRRALRK